MHRQPRQLPRNHAFKRPNRRHLQQLVRRAIRVCSYGKCYLISLAGWLACVAMSVQARSFSRSSCQEELCPPFYEKHTNAHTKMFTTFTDISDRTLFLHAQHLSRAQQAAQSARCGAKTSTTTYTPKSTTIRVQRFFHGNALALSTRAVASRSYRPANFLQFGHAGKRPFASSLKSHSSIA